MFFIITFMCTGSVRIGVQTAQNCALAPFNRAAENIETDQDGLGNILDLLIDELGTRDRMKDFIEEIDLAGVDISQSPALSIYAQDKLANFIEYHSHKGDCSRILNTLSNEIFFVGLEFEESWEHTLAIMNEINHAFTMLKNYDINDYDEHLARLTNNHYTSPLAVFNGCTNRQQDGQPARFWLILNPNAPYDIGIEKNRNAENSYFIYVRDFNDFEFINANSQYLVALLFTTFFPELELPTSYVFAPDEEIEPFDPLIRLFYDYVCRINNNISPYASYVEYLKQFKQQEKTRQAIHHGKRMDDPEGLFFRLDAAPQDSDERIRRKYHTVRRHNALSMISPAATAWNEKERRYDILANAWDAFRVLTEPTMRVGYDRIYRRKHPDIVIEAAA